MDFRSRMDDINRRKRQQEDILKAFREGKFDHIYRASELFERREAEPPREQRLLEALPHGRFEEDGDSRFVLLESRLKPDGAEQAYKLPIDSAEAFDRHDLFRHLAPDVEDLDEPLRVSDIAFVDTETTGLSGGTGMVAFLIGVGWFEIDEQGRPSEFVIEQYFIEDFCHEPLMLDRLVERLRPFRAFCTYNGKTFDLPLLRTRGVMNRLRPTIWRKPNLDLLHFSRRLWRGAFESVSLSAVEANVFELTREKDVGGAEIPAIWLDFVRTGRCERLLPVLHHNAQDIASLGSLLSRLLLCLAEPETPGVLTRASEFCGMSRWYEQQGDRQTAARLLERGLEVMREAAEEDAALAKLALLHRREKAWDRAVEIWENMLQRPLSVSHAAYVELAKYYEHQTKDFGRAAELVQQCLRQMELEEELSRLTGRGMGPAVPPGTVEALAHRLERLERRRARTKS
ncbi:ribonuclease H-like domain-containing protein [bacterium]|nr:ribonuclease H-like domain-containing protein [bacterium]